MASDEGIHTLNQTLQANGNQGNLGTSPLPDCVEPFGICTALISAICDEVPDSLRALAISGSKSRALMDDKITIIFWNDLVINILPSRHHLARIKLA